MGVLRWLCVGGGGCVVILVDFVGLPVVFGLGGCCVVTLLASV